VDKYLQDGRNGRMPKGPNGEKRPADVIGAAIMVGRIATGEVAEIPIVVGGRIRSGQAGGAARAGSLPPERRSEIARRAATKRWQGSTLPNVETDMAENKHETGKEAGRPQADAVLMYPSNQLGEQVRKYDDTQGVAALIKREFFDNR
jgi:hypothetical protein